MKDKKNAKRRILKERGAARHIGRSLCIAALALGLLGWVIWKWYALPISLGIALLAGSIYSYVISRRVEEHTGLDIEEQDDVLRGVWRAASRKAHPLPGFHYDRKDQLVLDLTDEEQARVAETFAMFEDYKVDPNYADEIGRALVCLSLLNLGHEYWNQASPMRTRAPALEAKEEVDRLLHKALAAYTKAFSIYSMRPILVFMATTFITMGKRFEAKACLQDYFTYTRPSEYSDEISNFFVQHFLQITGSDSLEEMDDDVKQLLSTLEQD